jgi:hypothetical protein
MISPPAWRALHRGNALGSHAPLLASYIAAECDIFATKIAAHCVILTDRCETAEDHSREVKMSLYRVTLASGCLWVFFGSR